MTRKFVGIIFGICILAGVLFFAFEYRLLIIRMPSLVVSNALSPGLRKKAIRFVYWKDGVQQVEWQYILWSDNDIVNARSIIAMYWSLLEENNVIPMKIDVQSVAADRTESVIICSLALHPCNPEASTVSNWLIIEGLLMTLKGAVPRFQEFWLLIQHKPISYANLDFSKPWPIEGFFNTTLKSASKRCTRENHTYTILIDPAGDAHSPGRIVGDLFEKNITWEFVQAVKDLLQPNWPSLKILITRMPGDVIEPLQNAAYANQVKADLYIHISMYQTDAVVHEISLFTFRWHPVTDTWNRQLKSGTCVPCYEAHRASVEVSSIIASNFFNYIDTHRPFPAIAKMCVALPYAPLFGIMSPAVGIEIGLATAQHNWRDLVLPVADMLQNILA